MFWLARKRTGYHTHTKPKFQCVTKRNRHANLIHYDQFIPKFLEDFDIEKNNLWGTNDENIIRWRKTSSNKIGTMMNPVDMYMLQASLFSKDSKETLKNYAEYSFSAMADCLADQQVDSTMTSNYGPFAQKMFSNWLSHCETNSYKWSYKFNGIKSSTFLASAAFLYDQYEVQEQVFQKRNFYITSSVLQKFAKFSQDQFNVNLNLDLLVWYRLESDDEMQVRGPDGEIKWKSSGGNQIIKLQLPFSDFTFMSAIEEGNLESFLGPVKIVDMNFKVAERLSELQTQDIACRVSEEIPHNALMAAYIN